MELKWVSCRKQSLFLISCLALLCLASLDTVSVKDSRIRVSELLLYNCWKLLLFEFSAKNLNLLTDFVVVLNVL
jgi:hypothetical protein